MFHLTTRQLNFQSLGAEEGTASLSSESVEGSAQDIVGVGFSMEQARIMADANQAEAMKRTPAEVLTELQKGNVRFWTGQATRPEKSAFERRALISRQFPSTAILSCADSRVPPEIVFDVGLGDMFVVRVAGNCLDTTTSASLQYAVHHLKVKLLVVMGHEGCGAIKAAQLPLEAINKEPESLSKLLKELGHGLELSECSKAKDTKAADREAVTTNVRAQMASLCHDEGIMGRVHSGELMVPGAMYEISSGIVDFFQEIDGVQEVKKKGSLTVGAESGMASKQENKEFTKVFPE